MSRSPRPPSLSQTATAGRDRRRALVGVTAVLFAVSLDQSLNSSAIIRVEIATTDEVLCHAACLVERPGLKCGDQLSLVDQPILKGKQAEQ